MPDFTTFIQYNDGSPSQSPGYAEHPDFTGKAMILN